MKDTTWYIIGAAALTIIAATSDAPTWAVVTAVALTVAATGISLVADTKARK